MLESLSRPHLLITDAYNALNVQARRKERDQALLSKSMLPWEHWLPWEHYCSLLANILKTLRSNGNILIAVDTAGRVLELSQLLVSVPEVCL